MRLKLIQTFKTGTKEDSADLVSQNSSLIKLEPNGQLLSANDLHVLHIAVQVASVDTVRYLYQKFKTAPAFDLNSQEPTKGDTPLHAAARYGNSEVAMYLMSLDELNDTILNNAGQSPIEVARTPELAEAMQVVRAQYIDKIYDQMKGYFASNDIPSLEKLLASARASGILDINSQDPETGTTLLYDFARARNAPMVNFILEHGGDPFRRTSKGVLPVDATKDESIRKIFKRYTKRQSTYLQRTATESASRMVNSDEEGVPQLIGPAPSMKGFLKKWTNFTSGYKLRWFVLENGVLSYYKRQGDTENACRGSINMKQARLHLGSSERLQFEVHSKGSVKFNLKANHPVETSRWVWALTNAIQYAKDQDKLSKQEPSRHASSASTSSARLSVPSGSGGAASLETPQLARQLTKRSTSTRVVDDDAESIVSSHVAKLVSLNNNEASRADSNSDDDGDDALSGSDEPKSDEIFSSQDSIAIGLTSIESTVKSIRSSKANGTLTDEGLDNGLSTVEQAVKLVNTLMKQYTLQVQTREEYFKRKIERGEELQAMWSQTIHEMETEKEKVEGQLHHALVQRKKTNKVLREVTGGRRQSLAKSTQAQEPESPQFVDVNVLSEKLPGDFDEEDSDEEFFDALGVDSKEEEQEELAPARGAEADKFDFEQPISQPANDSALAASMQKTSLQETPGTATESLTDAPSLSATEATAVDSKTEESPFPAEEVSQFTERQRKAMEKILQEKSFAGYEDPPRTRLKISNDERPKISLWGVLKSLIGKDMTKMTLPVSFNECTNLLMRSAEDMEYTELLEKAASIVDDPAERMVYIAAYAASSYSSTIDRVAKPFNPLLGETFEYCRPDKGFRMFSEQVSHHPPIGALIAESPRWDFYGASNVKSKFNGRSFDINPLGLWYITLRPNSGAKNEEEVYSFRKVTSSVVGIITGSPVVDQYGDMEITNHTLGYKCILNFKARGWRGTNAYEVKGTVVDAQGVPKWIVGGHWNDKIYAKKLDHTVPVAINNGAPASGDGSLPTDDKDSSAAASSRILVCQAHERIKAPFNLTQFAITLNALPDRLRDWIAPTDTRLRPDQRAMEEARYDDAAEEKVRVEEKQRAARRKREQTGEQYKPQWFELKTHPVSKEQYWQYKGNYWPLRAEHQLADKGDIF